MHLLHRSILQSMALAQVWCRQPDFPFCIEIHKGSHIWFDRFNIQAHKLTVTYLTRIIFVGQSGKAMPQFVDKNKSTFIVIDSKDVVKIINAASPYRIEFTKMHTRSK